MVRLRAQVVRNDLPRIGQRIPIAADMIVNRIYGPRMAALAAALSRVDTGEMQQGWQWVRTGVGTGQLQNDVRHVVFNEYGTRYMAAQPMLRPAIERYWPEMLEAFAEMEQYLR